MKLKINPFTVNKDGRELDYRIKDNLDLEDMSRFFQKQNYQVIELVHLHRNVAGVLEKAGERFRLKLAGSAGMSELLEIEINWNKQFNQVLPRATNNLWVPEVKATGNYVYKNRRYVYYLADEFEGRPLVDYPASKNAALLKDHLDQVINAAETIAKLNIALAVRDYGQMGTYTDFFLKKTIKWFEALWVEVVKTYQVDALLELVKTNAHLLKKNTRHGDFTPWHIFLLDNGKLGLIDGEHATSEGVEYYDIAYLIQRVFQVLENERLAEEIYDRLVDRGYDVIKLRTVLAARAIGGFLDASLTPQPDYTWAEKFKCWLKVN